MGNGRWWGLYFCAAALILMGSVADMTTSENSTRWTASCAVHPGNEQPAPRMTERANPEGLWAEPVEAREGAEVMSLDALAIEDGKLEQRHSEAGASSRDYCRTTEAFPTPQRSSPVIFPTSGASLTPLR